MPFDQSDDAADLRSAEQVAFPVARHGAVLYGSGSFPDGNRIRDLAPLLRCMPRATDGPPGPQVLSGGGRECPLAPEAGVSAPSRMGWLSPERSAYLDLHQL